MANTKSPLSVVKCFSTGVASSGKCYINLFYLFIIFIQNFIFMPAGLPDGMTQYGTITPMCMSGKAAPCRK